MGESAVAGARAAQRQRAAGERGSGTVLGVAVVMVLILVFSATLLLAQAAVAASRAATAADLAALAAADAARGLTDGQPCRRAGAVAARHDAELLGCTVLGPRGHIVDVRTAIPLAPWGSATARSRAGPPP